MIRVGDIVVRVKDVGRRQVLGDLKGIVVRVVPVSAAGGVRSKLRVQWENGFEGSVDDRQVKVVGRASPPMGSKT